jgi:hypothetical protein
VAFIQRGNIDAGGAGAFHPGIRKYENEVTRSERVSDPRSVRELCSFVILRLPLVGLRQSGRFILVSEMSEWQRSRFAPSFLFSMPQISEQGTKMGRRSFLHCVHGDNGLDGIDVGGCVTPLTKAAMQL